MRSNPYSALSKMILRLVLISCDNDFSCSEVKSEAGKRQDVMTLSDSDDVQTISSGSDEKEKEKEKVTQGKHI